MSVEPREAVDAAAVGNRIVQLRHRGLVKDGVLKQRILEFCWEVEERDWDPDKVRQMREATNQYDLFSDKYFEDLLQKDLHFFLGTIQQFHFVASNP
jgi:hypothetical protein